MKAFEPINIFIDREEEMTRLQQLISFSMNQEVKPYSYQRLMHLVGKSQVGKSFLLNKFGYELSQRETIFPLYITFEEYISLPRDKFALKILQYIDEVISTELRVKPQLVETSNIDKYSEWVLRGIEQIARKKIFVLLLDEVSMLAGEQTQLLEDYLLAGVLHFPNVVIVLAGRHVASSWKDFDLRPHSGNIIKLSGFAFELTQKQIQAINPHAHDLNLIAEIQEISGGSPGYNAKIVEQLGDPPQFNELNAIRSCNQEFYEALTSVNDGLPESIASELLPVLEALCVLQDFDKEYEMPLMLSVHPVLVGSWTVQRCVDVWNILSVIQIGPGKLIAWSMEKNALAMEEQTRFNLEKELKIQDVDLWKTLHCTAMKMYSGWADQYGLDSIFADKAEYHKAQLIKAGIDPEACG